MCGVAWCSFTWEAFATLMTGVLAVGAAVWVGLRQAKIMAEQTAIANRQVELEELKLRSDLFDRRVQVYETTHKWLAHVFQNAAPAVGALRTEYIRAMDKARFLFRPQVYTRMKELWDLAASHTLHVAQGDHQKANDVGVQLVAAGDELVDLFGPELRLGAPAQPPQTATAAQGAQ